MRRPPRKPLLAIFVGLAPFLLLELGLRVCGWSKPPLEMPIVLWNKIEDQGMNTEESYFQKDEHSFWALRPGATVQFAEPDQIDVGERINADGLRGPPVPRARTNGVLRIATLGDSSTFGVGVRFDDTFTAQLRTLLAARGVAAEVIDGGVDGFTVRQGLERWRHLVREWRPDVVIAAFGAVNEHWDAINFVTDDEKLRLLQERKNTWYALRRQVLEGSRVVQLAMHAYDPGARRRFADEIVETRARSRELGKQSGNADWPGKRRVSLDEFRACLATLQREVGAQGARLILVVNARRKDAEVAFPVLTLYSQAVLDAAADLKLQVLDVRGRFHTRLDDGSSEDELFIDDYWHPKAAGHRLMAEWLVPLVLDPALNVGRDE